MTSAIDEGVELGDGRYVLESRLGKGGAATVWLARDTVLDRPVAVKVLSEALAADESWLARFTREARIAAGITHLNLVSIYDFNAEPERPYIVMAHMPGGSLWDTQQDGRWTDPEGLAGDLLAALEAIHSAGIIHRDIKPGNVLFDANGTACLTDFGIARPEDATSLTQTGHIPGTARFMAPELWEGHPATERSDLYSAGIVLRGAVGNDASPQLERLIDDLTAEDPAQRPASASAALAALAAEAPMQPEPEPSTPVMAEEPTPRTITVQSDDHPHRRAAIAGLAVLAVVAVVAIAQALGGGDERTGGGANGQAQNNQGSNERSNSGVGSGQNNSDDTDSQASAPAEEEPVDAAALDREGKALIDAGDPEAAIPILEQAVDSYPPGATDLNYAYSLYNLADAYYQVGRPEDAIPLLEERLSFSSDQVPTVQALLDDAQAAAGQSSSGEEDDD